mmetsp:Transcript_50312/g.100183  ORF Transcript_50312/g.100183 Transcript_50312/m.100183 type:complete len:291 (-) Transcript_50312:289-1161(-)
MLASVLILSGSASFSPRVLQPVLSRNPCVDSATRLHVSPVLREPEVEQRGLPLPFFQRSIPQDQQPARELQALRNQAFARWAEDDSYSAKLRGLYLFTMALISLPVSYVTFDVLPKELPQLLISANMGTFAFMLLFIGRLRLAWGEVSGRLKSREVYFEENQRGNSVRKQKEVLLRDRLTQQTTVAPVLQRIDSSLFAITIALAIALASGELITAIEGESGPATLKTLTGDEATRFTNRLRSDDEFAEREQRRAQRRMQEDGTGVKPGYCDSRYYKILAGGNGQGGVGCD